MIAVEKCKTGYISDQSNSTKHTAYIVAYFIDRTIINTLSQARKLDLKDTICWGSIGEIIKTSTVFEHIETLSFSAFFSVLQTSFCHRSLSLNCVLRSCSLFNFLADFSGNQRSSKTRISLIVNGSSKFIGNNALSSFRLTASDSGGPLAVMVDQEWTLLGASSFSTHINDKEKPCVYSRVSKFCDFIEDSTQNAFKCT
ncbi:hypothetical protein L596_008767 [Steinernema carpocapsae]|uniref:Uncharacterized protein n=1 Tax=Steinernema carpocapsae TaxID=34508 RepID=A0A4U5PE96_STECR|nr:hypothetical protein L596_008767 [Steinernema carpocapsae]